MACGRGRQAPEKVKFWLAESGRGALWSLRFAGGWGSVFTASEADETALFEDRLRLCLRTWSGPG